MLKRSLFAVSILLFSCGGSSDTTSGSGGKGGSGGGTGATSGSGGTSSGGTSSGGTSSGGTSSGGTSSGGTSSGGTSSGGTSSGGAAGTTSGGTGGVAGSGTGGVAGATGGTGGATGGTGGTGGTGAGCGTGGKQCPGNPGFMCCNNTCINPNNDIKNCGGCGVTCTGNAPFCNNGTCGTPPCTSGAGCSSGKTCCGSTCCNSGELCCNVPGPLGDNLQCATPTAQGTCPTGCTGCVCTSPGTPIATPSGDRPIADIAVGDLVFSMDHGKMRAVRVREIHRVRAQHHVVVRVELVSGVTLEISPAHPTADGRTFAELKSGDFLDGVAIKHASVEAYTHDYTYDILPDSSSATYFAGGVLIGSTLAPTPLLESEVSEPVSR